MNIIEKLGITTGPWDLFDAGDNIKKKVPCSNMVSILTVVSEDTKDNVFGAVLNDRDAVLISAAPEILEALISIRAGLLPYRDESGVREVCLHNFPLLEPIITKATGKCWEEIEKMIKE
jgi:hypothetical protein